MRPTAPAPAPSLPARSTETSFQQAPRATISWRRRRGERTSHYELFLTYAEQARFDLIRLAGVVRDSASVDATQEAMDALQRYRENMRRLVDVTVRNDGLVADMGERANTLVKLTDEARERQHKSNSDIVASLADSDRKLRFERDIVDSGYELNAAIAAVALVGARPEAAESRHAGFRRRDDLRGRPPERGG